MQKLIKNNIFLLLVIILSIPATLALLHFGFYGASDDLHIAWLLEMDKLIKIGQFPPRFVPDLSFGFGYPLFNFVFPLPFYIGEIFHLIGFSFVDSIKMVFGLSLIGSGVSMYLFLREVLPDLFSLAGALIYVYTPYRSTDTYVRGALGEALAFVFLPVLLLGSIKIYKASQISKRINWLSASLISISLAALILSHDIVSYMFFPFFLVFIIFLAFSLKQKKIFLISNFLGIAGGLLISLYFWLPAIIESRLMAYATVFNFSDHFPTIIQLIKPYFGYGASVPGPYDLLSFFMGTLNWFLIIVGGILTALFWKKIAKLEKGMVSWAFTTFIISFFMMNYRSSFLWEHLPFLPYFQFPWRFLTMTTFTSVIFLIAFKYLKIKYFKYIFPALIIILSIALNYKYFKPHDFLERTDSYYINRYIPVPVASTDYLNTQEEYLRLPKDTEKRPNLNYPIVFSDETLKYETLKTNGIYSQIKVNLGEDSTINYSKYYFPGWTAKLDGQPTKIVVGKPFGQITVTVPKGVHVLEFNFTETWYKIVLDFVSMIAFIFAIIFSFKKTK